MEAWWLGKAALFHRIQFLKNQSREYTPLLTGVCRQLALRYSSILALDAAAA